MRPRDGYRGQDQCAAGGGRQRQSLVYPLDQRPPGRLTRGGSLSPLWSPDGQSIVYERYGTVAGLHSIAADGSGSVPRAVSPPGHFHAHGFIAGGRSLLTVFKPPGSARSWLLMHVALSGTETPASIGDFVLPDRFASTALSPDGRWLAYITDTTGSAELWVRRYPALDAAVRISPNGAANRSGRRTAGSFSISKTTS
jgi:Tol biopolymer transport system component